MGTWTLLVGLDQRPMLDNSRLHWRKKADKVAVYRHLAWYLARNATRCAYRRDAPMFTGPVRIIVTGHYGDKRELPDGANLRATAKPMIDGLVDAHIIPDDNPDVVVAETYNATVRSTWTGIELTVEAAT
jgi:crossover junction endodeoxyribonuclease RusA